MSDINVLGQYFDLYVFDIQRRSIPKAYGYSNTLRSLSKEGIKAVIDLNWNGFDDICDQTRVVWSKLRELALPKTFQEYQNFETAQEMIELYAVGGMFHAILDGGTMSVVNWESFSPEKIEVTPQAWLFGLLDAGSELSRVVNRYIIKNRLNRAQRSSLRERFLAIAHELNDFLDKFSEITPAVMDAYNRYGFKSSFRSKMGQIRGAIESQERFVLEAIERESD